MEQTPSSKVTIQNDDGIHEITAMLAEYRLHGELQSCCRTFEFEILVSPDDPHLPYVFIPCGGVVDLYVGEENLFHGLVFTKSKSTRSNTMTVTCFDMGYYLKNNYTTVRYDGETADAIAQQLCTRFGIPIWSLAAPGVSIRRRFNAMQIIRIIDTAYTLSSQENGKKYLMRFRGACLQVIERTKTPGMVLVRPGLNLQDATYSQSVNGMVNHVTILDEDGKVKELRQNAAYIEAYGMMHREIKEEKDRDSTAEADALLEEHGIENKCSLVVRGDPRLLTGETILLQEPFTGQNGVFWIDADEHIWRNGDYSTRLTLSYQNEMREEEAGSEVDDNG